MIRPNDRGEQRIINIMLSDNENINVVTAKSSPTRPHTLFFSVKEGMPGLCPPIF
jgi:hypothetical protein